MRSIALFSHQNSSLFFTGRHRLAGDLQHGAVGRTGARARHERAVEAPSPPEVQAPKVPGDRGLETGASLVAMRQTSMSFSFSATYTERATLAALPPADGEAAGALAPPMDISLSGLTDLFDRLKEAVSAGFAPSGGPEMESSGEVASPADLPEEISPEDQVKKLIVETFFGMEVSASSVSAQVVSTGQEGNSIQAASMTSIDFTLDFQGTIQWEGRMVETQMHLELHFQQLEAVAVTGGRFDPEADLRLLTPQVLDTGRYFISFLNSTTLEIMDKANGAWTRIWGDPHVDLSDVPGNANGEFSDLTRSSILTTFKLLDETTVVIKAPDTGVIEEVDVFKNGRHAKGFGAGNPEDDRANGPLRHRRRFGPLGGYFRELDGDVSRLASLVSGSDVVKAGGDGNDWFSEDGALVWGDGSGEDYTPVFDQEVDA